MSDKSPYPIRVGIQIQQQHATYEQIRSAWQAVDATTADSLFNRDHFFPLSGDLNGMHLDDWCAKVRRDPREIERSAQLFAHQGQLDRLDECLAAGITNFICDAGSRHYDLSPLQKLIAWRDSKTRDAG